MRFLRCRDLYPPLARGMCRFLLRVSGLGVREHRLDLMLLRLADVTTTAEAALRRRRLVREAVAQVRLLALDAPVGSQLEALLRAAVRLHLYLGHESGGV